MAPLCRIEVGWPPTTLNPNNRAHRAIKARARAAQKREAYWATCAVVPRCFRHNGRRITLTIHAHPAVRRNRDGDNLVASLKGAIDGLAEAMGIDDGVFDLAPVQWGERIPGRRGGWIILELGPSHAG